MQLQEIEGKNFENKKRKERGMKKIEQCGKEEKTGDGFTSKFEF